MESLRVFLFVCLFLQRTRGFVYKTFCGDSQGNKGGETVRERVKERESSNQENPLRFMSVFTIQPLLKEEALEQ